MLLGLPTPDENQAWKDKAEEMASKHDALQRLMAERYESEWKVTKDGKKRYRKVATKVLVNAWVTESEPIEQLHGTNTVVMEVDWSTLEEELAETKPIDPHAEYMRKLELEENGVQVAWE